MNCRTAHSGRPPTLVTLLLLTALFAHADGEPAPPPKVNGPRLYVFVCGTLVNNKPEDYNLKRDEVKDSNMGVTPARIDYLVLSHYHWDHIGNAAEFANSTW